MLYRRATPRSFSALFETRASPLPELRLEVLSKASIPRSAALHCVNRWRVRHRLDEGAGGGRGNDVERSEPQWQPRVGVNPANVFVI